MAFHLLAITAWALPASENSSPVAIYYMAAKNTISSLVLPYLTATGLTQNWNMFAPQPLAINFNVEAEVILRNGAVIHHAFPRMTDVPVLIRWEQEPYRKFSSALRNDNFSLIWPDVARWIARQYSFARNPPVRVALARVYARVPPPRPGDAQPFPPPAADMERRVFFIYAVQPDDVKPGDVQ